MTEEEFKQGCVRCGRVLNTDTQVNENPFSGIKFCMRFFKFMELYLID